MESYLQMLSNLVNVVQIINSSRGNVDCHKLGFEEISGFLVQCLKSNFHLLGF